MQKLLLTIAAGLVIAPIALLDASPSVPVKPTSSSNDAVGAKAVYRRFYQFVAKHSKDKSFDVSTAEANSIFALASRTRPGLRGDAQVVGEQFRVAGSVRVPMPLWQPWLNMRGIVATSDEGLVVTGVRIGSVPVPGWLAMPVATRLADLVIGQSFASQAVGGVDKVKVEKNAVRFEVSLTALERNAIAKRIRVVLAGANNIADAKAIRAHYLALDRAVTSGKVKANGSVVPLLKQAVVQARDRLAAGSEDDEVQAALLALALQCGHLKIEDVIGDVLSVPDRAAAARCQSATLGGRKDLRQHFIVSAGLNALVNSHYAFAIGEIKELVDSGAGGSGFSFDDLLADRAGIRFAELLQGAGADELTALLAQIAIEDDLLPPFRDMPSGLTQKQFEAIYRDIDSAAYKNLIAQIDRRINALFIHSS